MTQYPTIQAVADEVISASLLKNDRLATLQQFFAGMQSTSVINDADEELILTQAGFRQVGKMLHLTGAQAQVFEHPAVLDQTKVEFLQQMAQSQTDKEIQIRVNGSHIDGIVSKEYSFFDNATIMLALLQMQQMGSIPEDTRVMKHYLSPNARSLNLRLVAPESWDFKIQENGHTAPFKGTLIIGNNELGLASFSARTAITRWECTNSTIGERLFDAKHRFSSYEDFYRQLADAVNQVKGWSSEMHHQLENMRDIPIEAPMLIFEKIGEELGVPKYAMSGDKGAIRYWEEEGERNTLYDIVQAISAGSRELTVSSGRRMPKWDRRDLLEEKLWSTAEALTSMHEEGQPIEDWYLTGDRGIRERAALYIEGFGEQVKEAPVLADGIRRLEV